MLTSTVYDVRIKYTVDNRAGTGVRQLAGEVKNLGKETNAVTGMFHRLGAIAAGAFGIHTMTKAFIGFNSQVQNAKIGLSAMLQGNLGETWGQATENADRLYQSFQKFSQLTPVTTQEIMEFGKGVAVSTFQAGGAINDLKTITEQGVVAAKAFGYGSAYASLELSEMLSGNVNKRMIFAKQLLGMAHVTEEQFKGMTGEQRIGTIEKVLNSDAMKNAANSFGESWDGVVSTLEDKLQILFGKIGLPLFKAITKEVQSWNKWIDANTDKIDVWATKFADGLVTGFTMVKDAISFLVDHADTMLMIGKVWAGVKLGGMLGGGLLSGGASGRGIAGDAFGKGGFFRRASDKFNPETGGYEFTSAGRGQQNVTMKNIAGNLPLLGQAFGAGVALGTVFDHLTHVSESIGDALAPTGAKFYALQRSMDAFDAAIKHAAIGKEGFAATAPMVNKAGAIAEYRQESNIIRDYLRAQGAHDVVGMHRAYGAASEVGLDEGDLTEKRATSFDAKASQLEAIQATMGVLGNSLWSGEFGKLTEFQKRSLDVEKAQLEVMTYVNQQLAKHELADPDKVLDIMRNATEDPAGKHTAMKEPGNVNVTINRIEVQSDDPDRFVFGTVEAFRRYNKNPSQAIRAIREG